MASSKEGRRTTKYVGVEGVAQGSPRSPLIASLYLHDFDNAMNTGAVVCLRYIDDFFLGDDSSSVDQAFTKALRELKKISLMAYQPSAGSVKASNRESVGISDTPQLVSTIVLTAH